MLPPAAMLPAAMLGPQLTPRIRAKELAGVEPVLGHSAGKDGPQRPREYLAANEATLDEAAGRFLDKLRSDPEVAEGTLNMYECKVAHVVRVLGGDSRLYWIDARRVDDFIDTREGEGASRSTIHKELVALRRILRGAKRRGEYPRDLDTVMPERFRIGYKPRERFLTAREIVKLARELPPERAAAVYYIIATGARASEFDRARRSDIDGIMVRLRGTKTEGSDRSVPVVAHPSLLRRALAGADGEDDRLFSPWPGMNNALRRAAERAGIPHVTPNDLRRTFASHHVQRGVRDELVARAMGHASPEMVRKVYGRHTDTSLARLLRDELQRSNVSKTCQPSNDTAPLGASAVVVPPAIPANFVGHEGLEPSANGLRERENPKADQQLMTDPNDSLTTLAGSLLELVRTGMGDAALALGSTLAGMVAGASAAPPGAAPLASAFLALERTGRRREAVSVATTLAAALVSSASSVPLPTRAAS